VRAVAEFNIPESRRNRDAGTVSMADARHRTMSTLLEYLMSALGH
jgi:hypothetical protein